MGWPWATTRISRREKKRQRCAITIEFQLSCCRLLNPSTVAGHHHSVCPPRERVGGGEGWLGQREMVTMLELKACRRMDEESSSTSGEGEREESIIARRR